MFTASKEFKDLNLGFAMDEGQANPGDEFRVFYADRSPWGLKIKAKGVPGHGSKLFATLAMELGYSGIAYNHTINGLSGVVL